VPTITFRGSKAEAKALVRSLAAAVAGRAPDPAGLGAAVRRAAAAELLAAVGEDFDRLSAGGTASWGGPWPPLKPETVAYSRTPKLAGGPLGALSAGQQREWKRAYARTLARARLALGEAEARALAGKVAWATLKRQGATTKLAAAGGRVVPIGVKSGVLRASLDPGGPGNVLRVGPAEAEVGSDVPHFAGFHRRRQVWPAGGLPAAWWARVAAAAGVKVREGAGRLLGGG
jgi:hypothetical protein